MPTIAPEQTVEEIIAGWRRGEDPPGMVSPAGPRYAGGEFAEQEIARVGTRSTAQTLCGTWCTAHISPWLCC